MAGAGFKTFGVGDVLTASDVNGYLMQQAVMNFADSGARGSAIGTATEGMVSYLADTDSVEVYDGSAWTALGAAGIGSNVVQTVKTDTFTTTSASYTTVTGLTASITPSSASNKVLIIAQLAVGLTNNASFGHWKVTRGGTDIYVGDAASNRIQSVFGGYMTSNATAALFSFSAVYLDSPATTSTTTYQVETRRGSAGTCYLNRAEEDNDTTNASRGASSITVIEVAA